MHKITLYTGQWHGKLWGFPSNTLMITYSAFPYTIVLPRIVSEVLLCFHGFHSQMKDLFGERDNCHPLIFKTDNTSLEGTNLGGKLNAVVREVDVECKDPIWENQRQSFTVGLPRLSPDHASKMAINRDQRGTKIEREFASKTFHYPA